MLSLKMVSGKEIMWEFHIPDYTETKLVNLSGLSKRKFWFFVVQTFCILLQLNISFEARKVMHNRFLELSKLFFYRISTELLFRYEL